MTNKNRKLIERAQLRICLTSENSCKKTISTIVPFPKEIVHTSANAILRKAVFCVDIVNHHSDMSVI